MTTFTDSDFWSGGFTVRDPVHDGFTKLNDAMALLDHYRKEAQAIENVLGTDVAGSETNLATRLAERMAPSGIGRGICVPARQIVAAGANNQYEGAFKSHGPVIYQIGEHLGETSNNFLVTFTSSYTVAPDYVIAKYVTTDNSKRCGEIQVAHDTITTTQFRCRAKAFDSSKDWGNPADKFHVIWIAFGGS